MNSNEIWDNINEFEGDFSVSNKGQVKNNKTGNILKGDINNCGYHRVTLYHNGNHKRFFRHRLVADHFIYNDDPYNKKFVNHIDGNKNHNYDTNLEWVTQSENEKHAFNLGLKTSKDRPIAVVKNNSVVGRIYKNSYRLADDFNITNTTATAWAMNYSNGYINYNITQVYYL